MGTTVRVLATPRQPEARAPLTNLNANRTVAALDELQTWAWKTAGLCKQAAAVDALEDED
jgi:hypothetical protein